MLASQLASLCPHESPSRDGYACPTRKPLTQGALIQTLPTSYASIFSKCLEAVYELLAHSEFCLLEEEHRWGERKGRHDHLPCIWRNWGSIKPSSEIHRHLWVRLFPWRSQNELFWILSGLFSCPTISCSCSNTASKQANQNARSQNFMFLNNSPALTQSLTLLFQLDWPFHWL